jgi:1,4-dihydroxy-2-naphthoate octaprenyltransferase
MFWLDCSNDVYDSDTGADKDKKESVVNIVGRYCSFPISNRHILSACIYLVFRGETFDSLLCCAVEQ